MGLVSSTLQQYANTGYGYKMESNVDEDEARELSGELIRDHISSIDWVVDQFGDKSAGQLELDTTIIYIDQDEPSSEDEGLVRAVHEVKPHFTEDNIRERVSQLRQMALLKPISENH